MKRLSGLIIIFLLPACTSHHSDLQSSSPKMANPASDYCLKQGGELERNETGLTGICALPAGQRIEEWELYRQHNHSADL